MKTSKEPSAETPQTLDDSCVGAARKVSPDWSQKTMTCHSFNCFSIVWGQGYAPLVTPLPSSCHMAPWTTESRPSRIVVYGQQKTTLELDISC